MNRFVHSLAKKQSPDTIFYVLKMMQWDINDINDALLTSWWDVSSINYG